MFAHAFRGPHSLYRRYQALLESIVTATGFAAVVTVILHSTEVYPQNWLVVSGVMMAVLGIRWPLPAYGLAVALLTYPLFTINLYLAVLFLAVAALGHRLFIHYLGATTLVIATPLLAKYQLHWLVPILGGLWWGGAAGAWVGALASLWGKLVGGMAGMDIDWLILAGNLPDIEAIGARFETANSLNTLLLLIEPFATNSSAVLYHLLQVVGWAVAGGFVGTLAFQKWVKYRVPWSILVVTAGGGLILLATHIGLPLWLSDAVSKTALATSYDPVALLMSLLMVIIVGSTVYSLRESLDLPVAPKRSRWKPRGRRSPGLQPLKLLKKLSNTAREQTAGLADKGKTSDELHRLRRPVRVPHHSELPEWEPPQRDSGLIMLEID